MVSDRERFCAVLSNGPMLRADAIVVLEGDGVARLATALELFRQHAAPVIVLSGGLDVPPNCLTAESLAGTLYGMGVAPDRVLCESASLNTREQAVHVITMAQAKGWKRLLLVASPYHQYRAYLTFLHALAEVHATESIHLVNVPASNLNWWTGLKGVNGVERSRLELLEDEFEKCDDYQVTGHCASFAAGLAYLKHWEANR